MADGEVVINTKVNNDGLDKGFKEMDGKLSKAKKKVKETAKETKDYSSILNEASGAAGGFASKMKSIASAGGAYVAAAVAAIAATKKIAEVTRETAEAYKIQERAEQSLAVAAKNNPYISEENIAALKDYASELQKVSNLGDEQTIAYETQLVSAGRTYEEITSIISAAADISASGAMSFDSAIKNLNKSYAGLSGELGETMPEIKSLTEEELKNGKAVEIVAQKYKGLAATMADAKTQAANAKGDFKEAIGKLTAPTVNAWDKWWQSFYEKGVERVNAISDLLENASRKWGIGGIHRSVDEGVNTVMTQYTNKETGEVRGGEKLQTTEYLKWLESELKLRGNLNEEEQSALMYVQDELKYRERLAKYEAEQAEKERQRTAQLDAQNKARKEADDFAKASNQALAEELNRLEVEAKAKGESASAQDKYNVILQNYIALLTETEGKIQEGYPVEQKRLQQLKEAKKALDEETEAQEKLKAAIDATNAVLKTLQDMSISPTPTNALAQQIEQYRQIREQIAKMSEEQIEAGQKGNEIIYTKSQLIEGLNKNEAELEKQKVKEITALDKSWYDEYKENQQQLLDLKKSIDDSEVISEEEKEAQKFAIDEKYAQNKADLWQKVTSEINSYTQQAASIANDAANLMLDNVETETALELGALEEKYQKGEISEEEYYEKQKQIQQKAAREEYKIKMFQWTASLLAATANIAEGVSKAIAQGGVAGIVTGALVAAAGGVQMASIIASKPTPPNFAQGGVIGGMNGATMGGDNTYIHARAGEMVLNANQQRSLWDMLNGQSGRSGNALNMTVNNTQSNRVDTQLREENGEIILDIVDKRVNKGFIDGTFDGGYASMMSRQEGVKIL